MFQYSLIAPPRGRTPSLLQAKRLVVKIGTSLLIDTHTGKLKEEWLQTIGEDIARIKTRGTQVLLVTSGSITLGKNTLGLEGVALTSEESRAAAAVGQIRLAQAYETIMNKNHLVSAQILLTKEDNDCRFRQNNIKATLNKLLESGVVPIINENDTIATHNTQWGDNDRLAAQIAVSINADQLILLSDIEGLYTTNPKLNHKAKHIPIVERITLEIESMAGASLSSCTKGGMITKIMAAKMTTQACCTMAIALGTPMNPLLKMENGAKATWFLPELTQQHNNEAPRIQRSIA